VRNRSGLFRFLPPGSLSLRPRGDLEARESQERFTTRESCHRSRFVARI